MSDVEVATLFETSNVAEIKKRVASLKNQIQIEQGTLKQCARNNYLNLLKAAELVQSLGDLSGRLAGRAGALSTSSDFSAGLETDDCSGPASLKEQAEVEHAFKLLKEIKLLIDFPEQIWNALEGLRFLEASKLYLFAKKTYEHLTVSQIAPNQSVMSVAYNPEDIFRCLVGLFYIDGLDPIETVLAFLAGREQAIWKVLSDAAEEQAIADRLQQITYLIHTALRGVLHLFVVNGSVFFSDPALAALKRNLLLASNYPEFNTHSNWSEAGLVLSDTYSDDVTIRALDALPSRREAYNLAGISELNAAVESWFLALCGSIRERVRPILKRINSPNQLSQIHLFLGQLLDELQVPSLRGTEFCSLFYGLGRDLWRHAFHDCFSDMAVDLLKGIVAQNLEFQRALKQGLASSNQAQTQLWKEEVLWFQSQQQLEAWLSGQSSLANSTLQKVAACIKEYSSTCRLLELGPKDYRIDHFGQFAQDIYISSLEAWGDFIAELLELESDFNSVQLGKLLLGFKRFLEPQTGTTNLGYFALERDSRLEALTDRFATLSAASHRGWQLQLASDVEKWLSTEWQIGLGWSISQEVPAYFATSSLLTFLFDLNASVLAVLGRAAQKDVLQSLRHQIWNKAWPVLSSRLQEWASKAPTVTIVQGIFDAHFLYVILIGIECSKEMPSPLSTLKAQYSEAFKSNMETGVLKFCSATHSLIGSLAMDPVPTRARGSTKAPAFHNVLAMAAPWQRFRLID
ncbi:hypothetical protein L0F63_001918 [Massospora cicadina]|nr:hypothetical protein L0F63_001918 [Massospora cicadina]